MTIADDASILALAGSAPVVPDTAFVASGARIVGDVVLGERASVWYNAVLRGDGDRIRVGEGSNVQDGVAIHVDTGSPALIGAGVSIGHNATVHGCTIEDGCLIGMGSTVLSGAVVGAGSLVAAGAVVLAGEVVPPGSLVAGVPAKVRRALTEEEGAGLTRNAEAYLRLSAEHLDARAV